jgi:hypothetical protein
MHDKHGRGKIPASTPLTGEGFRPLSRWEREKSARVRVVSEKYLSL